MTRPNGFTLLEVLVTLVVSSMLLIGLTQGVRYGVQLLRSQMRIASSLDDLDAVDRALHRMIQVMDTGDGPGDPPIVATHDHLEFITTLPEGASVLPVRRVEATLLVNQAHRLVLRWIPYLHGQLLRPPPAPTETELLSGVSHLELSFWRPRGGWVDVWRYPTLPTLVRIRLVFPLDDPRQWPDIVAATALNPQ
jgi:prepilin-type N-terminal cleavage/methylation domain-containing protein